MISLSDEGFSVKCDVSSYKPDELKLRLDGDVLSIEGEHKEENEQGSVHLRLQRSIRIPVDQIDLSSLQSSLDQHGNLSIHAPLIEKKKQLNGQEIPIQITGQQKETGTIEN
ncbi:unnamed protein product, partial [Mesorhabditis belari]|uniref:SHSP domain-containing protein n=1 Tax=Mesorhabditis belari TaxID=2138241 RepID=A0AAF3EXS3_9BILA